MTDTKRKKHLVEIDEADKRLLKILAATLGVRRMGQVIHEALVALGAANGVSQPSVKAAKDENAHQDVLKEIEGLSLDAAGPDAEPTPMTGPSDLLEDILADV